MPCISEIGRLWSLELDGMMVREELLTRVWGDLLDPDLNATVVVSRRMLGVSPTNDRDQEQEI